MKKKCKCCRKSFVPKKTYFVFCSFNCWTKKKNSLPPKPKPAKKWVPWATVLEHRKRMDEKLRSFEPRGDSRGYSPKRVKYK